MGGSLSWGQHLDHFSMHVHTQPFCCRVSEVISPRGCPSNCPFLVAAHCLPLFIGAPGLSQLADVGHHPTHSHSPAATEGSTAHRGTPQPPAGIKTAPCPGTLAREHWTTRGVKKWSSPKRCRGAAVLFLTGHRGDSKAAGGVRHVAGPLLPMTYPLRPH